MPETVLQKKPQSMAEKIQTLKERREHLLLGGGADKLDKQRKSGKLTARERVAGLVDPGSFQESGLFAEHRANLFGMEGKEMPADGVVTGAASISGRIVHLASQDFSVAGGSAGEVHSTKVAEIMQQSLKTGSPFVFINDSGGAQGPGGYRFSVRLWQSIFCQRHAVWSGAASLADLRSVCRRRRL